MGDTSVAVVCFYMIIDSSHNDDTRAIKRLLLYIFDISILILLIRQKMCLTRQITSQDKCILQGCLTV